MRQTPTQRVGVSWCVDRSFDFGPIAFNDQRFSNAVQFWIKPRYQRITVQDGQGVIAKATSVCGLIDLPDVFKIKQLLGSAPRADDFQWGEEYRFRLGCSI